MSKPPSPAKRARLERRLRARILDQERQRRRHRWRGGALVLALFGLVLLGALRPLLLARPWYWTLLLLSLAVAAAIGWRLFRALGLGALARTEAWGRRRRLESLGLAVIALMLATLIQAGTSLALLGGVPALLHPLWARPATLEVRVEALEHQGGARGCAYRTRLNVPTHVGGRVPCALAVDLARHGLTRGPARLEGTRSWLGFDYRRLASGDEGPATERAGAPTEPVR